MISKLLAVITVTLLLNLPAFAAVDKMSLNFSAIPVRDLLQLLASRSGKNIVISEKISGNISIKLQQVSWREALAIVLQTQNLSKQESANTIVIIPALEATKLEQQNLPPAVLNLHYTQADEIAKLLKPAGMLSATGNAGAEPRTNTLVVADNMDKLANVKALVGELDVPPKQVLITAQIVSADENFEKELGLKFGTAPESAAPSPTAGMSAGLFNFNIASLSNNIALDLELAALESEGHGKVISSPKLLTTDRQAAYIESGAEIPYQEKTKEGDTSIAFKKAVLSLKVTPQVVSNNSVNLLLQLNQDKVSQLTVNGVPAIDTRQIQTQVLVRDGATIVLGGIYEWSKSKSVTTTPILSKIPLLGLLFRNQDDKLERKELLMFVTPKICTEFARVPSLMKVGKLD